MRNPQPMTIAFLVALAVTALVWILRGVGGGGGLLAALPGSILWVLLLLTLAAGVVAGLQRTR